MKTVKQISSIADLSISVPTIAILFQFVLNRWTSPLWSSHRLNLNPKMKTIRKATWFFVLTVGSVALSSQSQIHSRGGAKAKQTTPIHFGEDKSTDSTIAPNSNSTILTIATTVSNSNDVANNIDTSTVASKSVSFGTSTTLTNHAPVPSSSSLPPSIVSSISTIRNSFTETVETAPTTTVPISSITRTESESSTTDSGTAPVKGKTTAGTHASTSSSAAPIETSSRTIASSMVQDASTLLSSSKKSTTSFNEFTTTPASISAKETRESPGKIRPQIKLTTNYTSLGEVSRSLLYIIIFYSASSYVINLALTLSTRLNV